MNLAEFHKKYDKFTSHQKIKICCDHCGEEFEVLKTRAQQTIKQRGKYLDRSCGQKEKHEQQPVTKVTKQRIAKGVHESRFKKLIDDLEAHIQLEKVVDWDLVLMPDQISGVLWTVEKFQGDKWLIANLLDWIPKYKQWFFKEISELEGPVAVCCPLRLLRISTVKYPSWREDVKAFNREIRGVKPKMPEIVEKWLSEKGK